MFQHLYEINHISISMGIILWKFFIIFSFFFIFRWFFFILFVNLIILTIVYLEFLNITTLIGHFGFIFNQIFIFFISNCTQILSSILNTIFNLLQLIHFLELLLEETKIQFLIKWILWGFLTLRIVNLSSCIINLNPNATTPPSSRSDASSLLSINYHATDFLTDILVILNNFLHEVFLILNEIDAFLIFRIIFSIF